MRLYYRSLLALAADAAFLVSVGCEAFGELADDLGRALAKSAGVPYVARDGRLS